MINKDGSINIIRHQAGHTTHDVYYFLVSTSWLNLMGVVLLGYILVNCFFAGLYWLAGQAEFNGLDPAMPLFLNLFFFSVQTITTVGYGSIAPVGLAVNFIVSIEAMLGWVWFALVTSLLYSRFSRPSDVILFSKTALISPFRGGTSLQFRFINKSSKVLVEMDVKMVLILREEGGQKGQHYELSLEPEQSWFFSLSWPVIHAIGHNSPLSGKTEEDLRRQQAEILVVAKGYDSLARQSIHARYSYHHKEIVWGAVFKPMYTVDENKNIVLELDQIHDTESASLPGAAR
jgi:inward rectifier potassium channel